MRSLTQRSQPTETVRIGFQIAAHGVELVGVDALIERGAMIARFDGWSPEATFSSLLQDDRRVCADRKRFLEPIKTILYRPELGA